MAYQGQPVPSTVHNLGGGKVSDGKSVRVKVPAGVTVEAGKFYYIDGFLGCAFQDAKENEEVVLNIESAEYETDQIKTSDSTAMVKGTDIFWDKNNKYFTVSGTDVYAGKITAPADANNVIWFKLAERPYSVDAVTTLANQVGDLSTLNTANKSKVVLAVNEVNTKVGDLATLTTSVKTSAVAAINSVNAKVAANVTKATDESDIITQFNALIDALVAAGLMETGE